MESKRITTKPLSWVRRINAIKMILLPKITYKLQMLPLNIPQYYFKKLKSIIMRAVWKNRRARVSFDILKQEKRKGGLAIPDIQGYYRATLVSRAIEWFRENTQKRWVNIENSLSKAHLGHLIWNPPHYRVLDINTHSLTKAVFRVWDIVYKQVNNTYNSPLISLSENDYFAPGKKEIGGSWIKKGTVQLRDIIKEGKIATFQELKHKTDIWVLDRWRYLQLSHFISRLPHPIRSGEELSELEKICVLNNTKGIISKIYKLGLAKSSRETPPFITKWGNELGVQLDSNRLKKTLELTHSSSTDISVAEMNYKILTGWYITPDKASKYQKDKTSECWRGCKGVGNMAHIWWDCPVIKRYWLKILGYIKQITKIEVKLDPWTVLHHGIGGEVKIYKNTLVPHLLNAAKKVIAKNWQKLEGPLIWEWVDVVEGIRYMEEGGPESEAESAEGRNNWQNWKDFKKLWSITEGLRIRID